MPVRTEAWPDGTPAWVDISVSDLERSKAFYGQLFGWQFSEGSEEFGFYSTVTKNGHAVAGIGPAQPGAQMTPVAWMTYLAAGDAGAAAARAQEHGGQALMPVMAVGEMGSMAVLVDPAGSVFGLWQAGSHTGVDLFNEAGAVVWNEAVVTDVEAAKRFYADVFGYTYTDLDGSTPYATFEVDGETRGGLGAVGDGGPSRWQTYFSVADVDAAVSKVTELGGSVVAPPYDTPFGRMATVTGPDGEAFSLSSPPQSG